MKKAISILSSGGIVAYPTETFFGLGVDAFNTNALMKLSQLKGRPEGAPFPLLIPNLELLEEHVKDFPALAKKWIKEFWPGPLTIVLLAPQFPISLQGRNGGVGFRMSKHPIAQEIVSTFGQFITTTSANRSGTPPASTVEEVKQEFPEIYIVKGEKPSGGKPSTVVDFTQGKTPVIVREGAILKSKLGLS